MLINLRKDAWWLGERVGSGGFGALFAASSDDYPYVLPPRTGG